MVMCNHHQNILVFQKETPHPLAVALQSPTLDPANTNLYSVSVDLLTPDVGMESCNMWPRVSGFFSLSIMLLRFPHVASFFLIAD